MANKKWQGLFLAGPLGKWSILERPFLTQTGLLRLAEARRSSAREAVELAEGAEGAEGAAGRGGHVKGFFSNCWYET